MPPRNRLNCFYFFIVIGTVAPAFAVDPEDTFKPSDETRPLGLVVCRGTAIVLVCPADGMEPISNPFVQQEG